MPSLRHALALCGLLLAACRGDDDPKRPATPDPPEATATTGDTGTTTDVCDVATWDVAAEPVLRTWCTPCHASTIEGEARRGAPVGMDFDTWELASSFAALIRGAAVPDDARMPPEGMASAEDRMWLAHWVDCGAPGANDDDEPCDTLLTAASSSTDPCATGHNHVAGDLVADVTADLSCLCAVDGSLSTPGRSIVDAPVLERVGGGLDMSGGQLARLSAPHLKSIGGSLLLEGHTGLATLELPDLVEVGGDLRLTSGYAGTRVELEQLSNVGGDLTVQGLPTVEQLWLPRVEHVGGSYVVADNPALFDLPFFFELESVGGDLAVRNNPQLTEVVLATQLLSLGGTLEVGGNQLAQLATTYDLTSVAGDVYIHDEPYLTALEGLTTTTSVGGSIRLENLPALTRIGILSSLETVGGITLREIGELNQPVPTLVETVAGDVHITDCPTMPGLPFLAGVVSIEGDLELTDLPAVVRLPELSALRAVGGDITISGTGVVRAELSDLRVSGAMLLEDNAHMQRLVAGRYDGPQGDFVARRMPQFEVFIVDNPFFVIGDLVLDDLDALVDLTPLHALRRVAGDVVIQDNASLTPAAIQDLVDAIDTIDGTVITTGNG